MLISCSTNADWWQNECLRCKVHILHHTLVRSTNTKHSNRIKWSLKIFLILQPKQRMKEIVCFFSNYNELWKRIFYGQHYALYPALHLEMFERFVQWLVKCRERILHCHNSHCIMRCVRTKDIFKIGNPIVARGTIIECTLIAKRWLEWDMFSNALKGFKVKLNCVVLIKPFAQSDSFHSATEPSNTFYRFLYKQHVIDELHSESKYGL